MSRPSRCPNCSSGPTSRSGRLCYRPLTPLVYDRDRTARLFGFSYKLEMYKPVAEREFGHFVLPILHDGLLVGRLDSERDRKTNELVVRKLHWEGRTPPATVRGAVNQAVDELREFVRSG